MKFFKLLFLCLFITTQHSPVQALQAPEHKTAAMFSLGKILVGGFLSGVFLRHMANGAKETVTHFDLQLMKHPEIKGSLKQLALFFVAILLNKLAHDALAQRLSEQQRGGQASAFTDIMTTALGWKKENLIEHATKTTET